MKASAFIGSRFGMLTVECDSGKRRGHSILWQCACDCGKKVLAVRHELTSGKVCSCGCLTPQRSFPSHDLTNRRFGRLSVAYRVESSKAGKQSRWHCVCDCGKEVDVFAGNLLQGFTQSCGCLSREQSASMHDHLHYQDNTCLERLERIPNEPCKNKTGFRGIFLTKKGKYRASLTFRGKHYTLGYFDDFERAKRARLEAEDVLQVGYVNAYKAYKAHACHDPDWAAHNPFYFQVLRRDGTFDVSTNGDLF